MQHKYPRPGNTTAKGEPPLQAIIKPSPEALVRQTWLYYYNDYLRERGIITEEEWRKMRRLIEHN